MSNRIVIRVLTEKIQSLESIIIERNKQINDLLLLVEQKTKAHDKIYQELVDLRETPIAAERKEVKG